MSRTVRSIAVLAAATAFAGVAQAQYTQTLPEFNGPFHDVGEAYPFGPFNVGTFTGLSGAPIVSATLTGTFGNSQAPNSSGVDVYLGSLLVAQCVAFTACYSNQVPTPWTFTFTAADFGALAGPTADLTAWQTSQYYIRLGPTTLNIEYGQAAVPEPASLALLGTGLVGLIPGLRRKFRK